MSLLKEKFCARLRVIRAEKGLTQENLAEMLGMSPNGYSKIERGETDVSLAKVEEIAKALEADIPDLLQLTTTNTYVTNAGSASVVNNQGTVHSTNSESMVMQLVERVVLLERELAEVKTRVK